MKFNLIIINLIIEVLIKTGINRDKNRALKITTVTKWITKLSELTI